MYAIQHKQDSEVIDQFSSELPIRMIDGVFDITTAKTMLTGLIEHQSNHYKIKNWKSQVNKECSDDQCLSEIQNLNEARMLIHELCNEAKQHNRELRIRSNMHIEFVERNS